MLNISNIFRDHRIPSKLLQYFENLDPPLICYQNKTPIENIILTITKLLLILKADMKSYKSLETAAIFYSSEPFLKQGIS